jgi:3-hydroxyisobutyrate dehydrogenase
MLGLGAMGHGMAASALRAGIPTIVWDRRAEAAEELAELGAQVTRTADDAARRAAIVVTMVTDADAVISIARDQGMLAALAPGAIWAQMSTIGVAGIDRVAAMVRGERPDVLLLDAPVSGSREPAVAASLALGRRLGLETTTMVDVLGGSSLVSPWQAAKLQRIADGDFSAQFALSLALKDVYLALQAAGDGRFAVLACLADEWQQALDQGLGGQDLTVVERTIG